MNLWNSLHLTVNDNIILTLFSFYSFFLPSFQLDLKTLKCVEKWTNNNRQRQMDEQENTQKWNWRRYKCAVFFNTACVHFNSREWMEESGRNISISSDTRKLCLLLNINVLYGFLFKMNGARKRRGLVSRENQTWDFLISS